MSKPDQIMWPGNYEPSKSPVHAKNQLSMPADPEVVWAWLIRASFSQHGTLTHPTFVF
ncbi:MAG: hypothetical protein ABSF44_10795 [Candidatus Bathyarchaeia archaeon]